MAIEFVDASSHALNTGSTNTIDVPVPDDVRDGDVMVLSILSIANQWQVASGLDGWIPLADTSTTGAGNSAIVRVYRRVASSEPEDYTVVSTVNGRLAAGIVAYRGVDPSTPVIGSSVLRQNTTSTEVTTPNVTIANEDCWLLTIVGARVPEQDEPADGASWTISDESDAERFDACGVGSNNASLAAYDSDRVLAPATYRRTLTVSEAYNQVSTVSLVIQPETTPISSDGFIGWGVPV